MYGLFSTLLLVLKPFLSKFKIVSLGKCFDRGVEAQPKERREATSRTWGPFLESPDNFSGPESYIMCAMFALKTQILLVLKADQ